MPLVSRLAIPRYGSKQHTQEHVDIVPDYLSAKVIKRWGAERFLFHLTLNVNGRERSASTPGTQTAGTIPIEPKGDQDPASHIEIEQSVGFDSAALIDNFSDTMAIPSNESNPQLQRQPVTC